MLSAGWRFGHMDTINTAVTMFHHWMNGSIARYLMIVCVCVCVCVRVHVRVHVCA